MDIKLRFVILSHLMLFVRISRAAVYPIDDSPGLGRKFDGIGGLSGGGATSKLLVNYPEPQRSQILDYLFKPNFGASLQILKVEIGGDSQSTDGTESSHMHEENDENYQRGYEWWLMVEAIKRNPDITLYALPWAFPGWIGEGSQNPYVNPNKTANYIVRWILGAKKHYNLTIDYIGIWNERQYNIPYNLVLRATLDANSLSHVKIVTADGNWGVSKDVLSNVSFANTVDVIGVHYPGTQTTAEALSTNKTLWSSEDYSTFNNNVGAGCWARILNQNYVNGHMTSTISWNLIAAYYNDLPFQRSGLMTSVEPWSGHYVVESPIWITAHTSQFVSIGWHYLQHGHGVGHLKDGGTYVSLLSPDKEDFTIIMETMKHDHSLCVRPHLPAYVVHPQNVTFVLKGSLGSLKSLNVWHSKLGFQGKETTLMKQEGKVQVLDGQVTVSIGVDEIITLSTVTTATKGAHPAPPGSKPFPLPYQDDFEVYPLNSEAYNFVPQIGVWEVQDSKDSVHGKVNAQVVLHRPVDWCNANPVVLDKDVTINIGGNYNWTDLIVGANVLIPSSSNSSDGVLMAARLRKGGCGMKDSEGVYAILDANADTFELIVQTGGKNYSKSYEGAINIPHDKWFNFALAIMDDQIVAFYNTDTAVIMFDAPATPAHGFVGYGTLGWGQTWFDDFAVDKMQPGFLKHMNPKLRHVENVHLKPIKL